MSSISTYKPESITPVSSPAAALWNQRHAIAKASEQIRKLSSAVGRTSDFTLFQWAQFMAFVLEFKPDTIIELGRGLGNSTCCFLQVIDQLGGKDACKLVSFDLGPYWEEETVPKIRNLVPEDWFEPAQILVDNILTYDLAPVLKQAERCVIFWDAHGVKIADCVLGTFLPLLKGKPHLLMMHDICDRRYPPEAVSREYGPAKLWRGENATYDYFWLGHIVSSVAQTISAVDFTSRNGIPFHSASESLYLELFADKEKVATLRQLLGDDLFSFYAYWFWFTPNEAARPLTFPTLPQEEDPFSSQKEGPSPTAQALPAKTQRSEFSVAGALWDHRQKLASMRQRIEQLYTAVASPGEMSLHQWAQFTATVLEFQPDLIIELGRGAGNATACFLEAVHQLGEGRCKVLSVGSEPTWHQSSVPRLKPIVPEDWFNAGQIVQGNILSFDFQAILQESKRCLVFWDAQGFEVAECVLGGLLPMLQSREHLVLLHDFSDLRYSTPSPDYGTSGLWKGQSGGQETLWLGRIFSRMAQSISVLDFTTRNKIALHSADQSMDEDLATDERKIHLLQSLLGPELAVLQSDWFWFTLNGASQKLTFPCFSAKASMQRFEEMVAFDAARNSMGWRVFRGGQKFMKRLFPEGSKRRKVYRFCLSPLRKLLT